MVAPAPGRTDSRQSVGAMRGLLSELLEDALHFKGDSSHLYLDRQDNDQDTGDSNGTDSYQGIPLVTPPHFAGYKPRTVYGVSLSMK